MRPRPIAGALLSGALLLIPSFAWSQGPNCANATLVPPDGRINGGGPITAGATFFFQVATTVGNSYSFEVVDAVDALGAASGSFALTVFSDACVTTLGSNNTKTIAPGVGAFNARISWTATTTSSVISLTVPASMTFSAVTWTGNDTTLYNPAWSTIGAYDTFYSFKNTTGATISGTLTLFNTGGTAVTTQPVTILPAAAASTNTSVMGTTRNLTGTANFVHNGPPGAILAEANVANFTLNPPYNQVTKFQPVREIR